MILKSAQKVHDFAHVVILHHGGKADEERVYGGAQFAWVTVDFPFLVGLFPLALSGALSDKGEERAGEQQGGGGGEKRAGDNEARETTRGRKEPGNDEARETTRGRKGPGNDEARETTRGTTRRGGRRTAGDEEGEEMGRG